MDDPEAHPASSGVWPLAVLIVSACVLGLAPILVRLTETGPAAAGFWRFAFALPLLAMLCLRRGGEGVGAPDRWMALAGVFLALDLAFWHYGIALTSVVNATVLCNLTPVVVTLFGWIVLKEPPRRLFLLALVLALGGAFGMAAGSDPAQVSQPALGDLFSLSVAVWYAGYFLAVKAARQAAGALRITLWASLIGAPLMLLAALAMRETLLPATLSGWAACAGMGLVHVVGQGGVAWALGRLPTSTTAVTILIQPIVAGALGWFVFGESLTPIQAAGAVIVLIGVALAQRANLRPRAVDDRSRLGRADR
ncbi:DMT family transporter [Brevundimonas sp. SH203]|uniref:DMT family transporter n=1 Tax=Brevundimonas sp. SH203 TaxID=345167 RepID=UPI000B34C42F|nr:DMT family transporter [Brevundimonas sp. SH203]